MSKTKTFLINITLLSLLGTSTVLSAEDNEYYASADFLDMDLSDLSKVKIYTASRTLTDIDKTSAIVTVITKEDIQRRAYRTVGDVMQDIPGTYYNTTGHFPNLTNRGISQALTSYLLLIDGHAVNNRAAYGVSVETMFPILSDVERIEVVRGPGSVLWGTDAGIGIIHIMTKSGKSMDKTGEGKMEVFVDYEVEHQRQIESAVYGQSFEDADIMFSIKTFDSAQPWGEGYKATSAGPISMSPHPRYNAASDFDRSGEFGFKLNMNDFSLKGQVTRFKNHGFHWSQYDNINYDRDWVELAYNPQLSSNTKLQNRVYYNNYITHYNMTVDKHNQEFSMQGGGVESILFHNGEDYSLTLGLSFEQHDVKFHQGEFGAPMSERSPDVNDKQYATFGELTYSGIENFLFTMGARYQKNDGILQNSVFLPRLGLTFLAHENFIVKYMYNTSEVAPTSLLWQSGGEGFVIGNGLSIGGAQDSQKYQTHDLQFIYTQDTSKISLNFFYITVEDMVQFAALNREILGNGLLGTRSWINGSSATSKGVQLELQHDMNDAHFYADYTYTSAKIDDRYYYTQSKKYDVVGSITDDDLNFLATPANMWNIGVDIDLKKDMLLNIHYRGYSKMKTKWTSSHNKFFFIGPYTYKDMGTQHFFDTTYVYKNAFLNNLDITAYMKNITNNTTENPETVYGGYTQSVMGRRYGMTLLYTF